MSDALGGALTAQLGRLAATLRAEGVHVGVGDVLAGHRALAAIDASSRTDSYNALRAASARATRTSRPSTPRSTPASAGPRGRPPTRSSTWEVAGLVLPRVVVPGDSSQPAPEMTDPRPLPAAWSDMEILRHKDFADYTDSERELARRLMARLALRGPTRRSRRLRPSRLRGAHGAAASPDLRRTLRASLRYGGEPIERRWREPSRKPRPLVLVCDVSGSMEPYARMLLQYLHAYVVAAPARGGVRVRHAAHARHARAGQPRARRARWPAWPPPPATGRAARASGPRWQS